MGRALRAAWYFIDGLLGVVVLVLGTLWFIAWDSAEEVERGGV